MSESDLTRDETVPEFWDRAHRTEARLWLTGSTGAQIWDRLDVRRRIRPGATVLNIGVGLGHCTRDLKAAGCIVHVLDISPVALDRVRDIAVVHRAGDALPRRTFDLALSHLVAQHMTDADLIAQIKTVLPALRWRGVLAMQFASLSSGETMRAESDASVKGGGVVRLPTEMIALVQQARARVVRMIERETYGPTRFWVAWIAPGRWWQRGG